MPILNYTTKIDPDKTAAEIARCLSLHGASAVLTEYNEKEGYVEGISFQITLGDRKIGFKLPVDWKPVYEIMSKGKKFPYNSEQKERMISGLRLQSIRTAWRIVKDWVEAQMALVETQMVTTQEVFLPYAVTKDGRTLSQKITEDPSLLLESK